MKAVDRVIVHAGGVEVRGRVCRHYGVADSLLACDIDNAHDADFASVFAVESLLLRLLLLRLCARGSGRVDDDNLFAARHRPTFALLDSASEKRRRVSYPKLNNREAGGGAWWGVRSERRTQSAIHRLAGIRNRLKGIRTTKVEVYWVVRERKGVARGISGVGRSSPAKWQRSSP